MHNCKFDNLGQRLLTVALAACCLSTLAQPIKTEQIAPGLWRIRMGQPEKLTPETFRSAPVAQKELQAIPAQGQEPFSFDGVRFSTNDRGCMIELPLGKSEQVYGFGLNTKLFNMTDRRVWIRTSDAPESDLNDSHAPVPFYVTTGGYGVYVDSARYVSFYSGIVAPSRDAVESKSDGSVATSTTELYKQRQLNSKIMLIDVPAAKGVDVYVFGGPTMKEAVQRYNLFSGGGCLPPMWGLGVWYRAKGDFNAQDCIKLAKSFRESHMPCDVWGLEPGWQSQAYSCSFVWNQERFPNPDEFVKQMRAMDFHMNAWEHVFVHPSSPVHKALEPLSGNYLVWGGLVPDFGLEKARSIFAAHQDKVLFQKGIESVKLDECDNQPVSASPWSFPECSTFPSGLDGEQMHGLLGTLYQQTMWETPRKNNLRTYNSVRASHALAAPLPYVIYSDTYDHRCYVRGMAKSGFAGVLWTPELRDANSAEDLYRRVETIVFSAQTLVNCWYMKNPPWLQMNRDKSNHDELMAEREEVTAGVKRLFELRMSLIPYLYSAFADYRFTGTPPFRAVVMDFPQDTETWKLDDEYMVGPSLLVAPIFSGKKSRSVYLPKGEWFDFWTGERLSGGAKLEVTKPLDQIPVYVKSGSLLPMAKPVECVKPDTRFEVALRVYGEKSSAFTLYEDDGVSYDYDKGAQKRITLTWNPANGGKLEKSESGNYSGAPRYRITSVVDVANGAATLRIPE